MGILERTMKALGSRSDEAPDAKPGRNDLCWCGSGKKYKKCHLPEDDKKTSASVCALNCGPT